MSKLIPFPMTKDFMLEISKGNIPGHSFDRKFGSINTIQIITPADVWYYGITSGAEIYTWSADGVADIDTMSSSNVNDTEDITIVGLDIDGVEVTQTKALNGQTKVTLDTSLWRVNRTYNSNGAVLLGDVYIYVDGAITTGIPNVVTTVRAFIPVGEGQTLQAVYTVPAGKTAYFMGLEASLISKKTAIAELSGKVRAFGKVFRTQDVFNLATTGSSIKSINFPIPLPFTEKSDFCPQASVSVNDTGISWAFTILLVDN